MVLHILYIFIITGLWLSVSHAGQKDIAVSRFSQKNLENWQEKTFAGKTDYSFVEDENKGWVLKADSHGTASGLFREMKVDISTTPYLNWSWKVETLPAVVDEQTREGDDYPARIYVIFKTGPWFWQTKALNYVWSSTYAVGETWSNAYTANACMVVVQSGRDLVGRWVGEKHNVKDDIASCFGIAVDTIDAVAVMSDSDDSKKEALAYYSDISFTAN